MKKVHTLTVEASVETAGQHNHSDNAAASERTDTSRSLSAVGRERSRHVIETVSREIKRVCNSYKKLVNIGVRTTNDSDTSARPERVTTIICIEL